MSFLILADVDIRQDNPRVRTLDEIHEHWQNQTQSSVMLIYLQVTTYSYFQFSKVGRTLRHKTLRDTKKFYMSCVFRTFYNLYFCYLYLTAIKSSLFSNFSIEKFPYRALLSIFCHTPLSHRKHPYFLRHFFLIAS